ncbi:MAG: hypothetical protein V3S68_09260 [Dehalococcoidia bacterium]
MPMKLLWAYSKMLPRLQAEEAMQMSTIIAMGGGKLKKGQSRRIMAAWQRTAHRHIKRVQTAEEVRTMLTGIGVG